MENLVLLENDQAITTSLKIAEVFEKRHDVIKNTFYISHHKQRKKDNGLTLHFEEGKKALELFIANDQIH